jgi:hypothetical protein
MGIDLTALLQAKAQRHYFDMVTLLRQLGVTA